MGVFEEGELVIKHLRKEIFHRGTYKKLKYKKVEPCRILRKNSESAYKQELLENLDISLIFNVVDLYEFHEGENNDEEGTPYEWKQQPLVKIIEEVEESLATRVGKKTRQMKYLEYLIKWKNRGNGYASWVYEKDLTHL